MRGGVAIQVPMFLIIALLAIVAWRMMAARPAA